MNGFNLEFGFRWITTYYKETEMLRPVLLLVLPTVVGGYSVGITGDVNLNPSLKAQDPTYVGVMFRAV